MNKKVISFALWKIMIPITMKECDFLKELPARMVALEEELSQLKAELLLLKDGRNSRTSSTPPLSGYRKE
ncbi:MAG: hypothetical protein LBE13_14885 [Bacteroidales bacterium]|jgi:hypothetical protein|nr:hypothetical protein [Bacteroidales bacterium]